MKLYRGKIPIIAQEITRQMIESEAIEVEDPANIPEVRLDIEAILKEYLRADREISDEARDIMSARGDSFSAFGRTKRTIARRRKFGLGDESIDWIINQLLEMLLHTVHIDEVWAEDRDLRKIMRVALRKHMDVEENLDKEVRNKIKNLSQGSDDWDVKYQQEMERLKRLKGLDK